MTKATFLMVEDGWHGFYVNGELVQSSDNDSIYEVIRLLENAGILKLGQVEIKEASHEVDAAITVFGEFPKDLPKCT